MSFHVGSKQYTQLSTSLNALCHVWIQWQGLIIPLHIQKFLGTLKVKEQQAPQCDFKIEVIL
jgi:hypothetical protein